MTFSKIERKIKRPPAAQNFVSLNDLSCEYKTAEKIVKFALNIPSFNYLPGVSQCRARVQFRLDVETAVKAVRRCGAPSGREQNENFVRAFYDFDERRGYSKLPLVDHYRGKYLVARGIEVPTVPTFVVYENNQEVPVIVCGWKTIRLDDAQMRYWMSILEDGLFSYGDYRRSPAEIVMCPEIGDCSDRRREPLVVRRGDFRLFGAAEMRDFAEMYVRAQEIAMPIAADRWAARQSSSTDRPEDAVNPDLDAEPKLL